jgi:hypothetical protein
VSSNSKVEQANAHQKRIDQAFYRCFMGVSSPADGELVLTYLRTNYDAGVRRDKNHRVDPHATLAAAGERTVISDIERRIERGRLA